MLTDVMQFPLFCAPFFCNNVVNPAPHVFPFIFMCVCKIESRDAPKGRSTPYPTTAFLALVANKMQQQHRFVPHFVKKLRSNNSKGFMVTYILYICGICTNVNLIYVLATKYILGLSFV